MKITLFDVYFNMLYFKVGLLSEILHAQFALLFGGVLEIVRRCESYTCYGHCVCAVEGQLCLADDSTCVDSSGIG